MSRLHSFAVSCSAVAFTIGALLVTVPARGVSAVGPDATGVVVDGDHGLPVAGATVVVSRTVLSDDAATKITTSAVTNADGSFDVANVPPGRMTIQVLPRNGYPELHRAVDIDTTVHRDTLPLVKPSATETAWLARINAERAKYGLHPVVFDQAAMASARYWSHYMAAHAYFDHVLPNADPDDERPGDATPVTRYLKFSGLDLSANSGMSENIAEFDGDASWGDAEDMFMAEKAKCPGGRPTGCAYSEATGHFLNILNPDFKWVGLGIARHGDQTYYDQEFIVGA